MVQLMGFPCELVRSQREGDVDEIDDDLQSEEKEITARG